MSKRKTASASLGGDPQQQQFDGPPSSLNVQDLSGQFGSQQSFGQPPPQLQPSFGPPQQQQQSSFGPPQQQPQLDAASFKQLHEQVTQLSKDLKRTTRELEDLKKADQSRSSNEFSFGSSMSLQSTSALNLSNIGAIRKNEPIASFKERFTEYAKGVEAPEAVQKEVLIQKVAPRCDISLLFGPKVKTKDALNILEAIGDRVRTKPEILTDFMSLELSTRYGCRKFCERHARLVNEARAHPDFADLTEDFYLSFIRDAVGPRTREILRDFKKSKECYIKLMQLDNLGLLFDVPAKPFRKDKRRDRPYRSRYHKNDQRQLTQPKGDGHRDDHKGKDTRAGNQSRGGRGGRGFDQRPRHQGPQRSSAVNVVDEYDELEDDVEDRYDDHDDYEEEVRPSSYAVKTKHPRINYSSC